MSSTYSIDFSEPLKVGFEVPAGGFDGPGAAQNASHTSLRLHGRGALEWGEAVNEDLVRLTENFASASPPINMTTGQMWVELKLYHYNGSNVFKRFNLETKEWEAISVALSEPTSNLSRGDYWWDSANGILWGYYDVSTVGISTYGWRPRSFSTGGTIANGDPSPIPQQTTFIFNSLADDGVGGTGAWVPPQSVSVAATDPSLLATPSPGDLWFNSSTGALNVWDGIAWQTLVTAGAALTSDIDMGGLYKVINLPTPTNSSDAATKLYVDQGVSSALSSANNAAVLKTGSTMSGYLTLVGSPSSSNHAATKAYVDAAVGGAIGSLPPTTPTTIGAATVFANPSGSISYNAGDIAIAGGKIYIALTGGTSTVPGGGWKQVWPATYS